MLYSTDREEGLYCTVLTEMRGCTEQYKQRRGAVLQSTDREDGLVLHTVLTEKRGFALVQANRESVLCLYRIPGKLIKYY